MLPESVPLLPERLDEWLGTGAHGTMDWMAETAARRASPRVLWPQVQSIALVAMNYGPTDDPLAVLAQHDAGAISVYARHRDYHDVIKGKLKTLASKLKARAKRNNIAGEVKVFIDTAPVMEKPLAAAAGLGWQGKHTNLVSRDFGSWLFLGSIFTTLDLPPDEPAPDQCGTCRACLDVCPTNAFPAPYRLDARRCISYLTIEHDGPIPHEFRNAIGNRIYGCDDCLAACPWNKFAQAAHEAKLIARTDLAAPPLAKLAQLGGEGFRTFFSGSPIKRIGWPRFLRNVLIAIGNSGDAGLARYARAHVDDESAIVRGTAVHALAMLLPSHEFAALAASRAVAEADRDVMQEWTRGLEPAQA